MPVAEPGYAFCGTWKNENGSGPFTVACGDCNNGPCNPPAICQNGQCVCPGGKKFCKDQYGGRCVDMTINCDSVTS